MVRKKKKTDERVPAGPRDFRVILRPIITEKASQVGSGVGGAAVFRVHPDANKLEIRRAVERIFKVDVQAVRTCTFIGKVKRTNRSVGRRPGYKKAYVTLKEGQSIDIVEGL